MRPKRTTPRAMLWPPCSVDEEASKNFISHGLECVRACSCFIYSMMFLCDPCFIYSMMFLCDPYAVVQLLHIFTIYVLLNADANC
jgi:hypothetical protein